MPTLIHIDNGVPEKFEQKASAFMQRAAIDSGRWLEIYQD